MSASVFVFDLDGTLVDTKPDLAAALNAVLHAEGLARVMPDALGHLYGQGARAMLCRGLAENGIDTPDEGLLDRLQTAFIAHYAEHIAVESRPFPGALEAVAALRAQGHKTAICTNKKEHLALRLLDVLGLTGSFDALVGGDTFACSKPHAEPLLGAIARAGGEPTRAVMIGDSRTDIDAARNARIPVVAVTFGYSDTPVAQLSPDAVISHFDALARALADLSHTA
ncbi:HAD family hydrolase [Stappia sp.]|uniref:HAD family hydrolase n=1 Tax=Stappia sp. TaxID=1870903 RepID=UPI0032D9199D